jgi:serine/threonine-protein kinase
MHLGPYTIDTQIGEGAFATVYRAVERASGRVVAIKVLRPELMSDPDFVSLFEDEVATVKRLAHPGIISIFDVGLYNQRLCQIMDYAAGGSLADHLRRLGPLEWDAALTLLELAAPALDHAHAQGVVHRDLKPANLLIDAEGKTLLTDFGLAELVSRSTASRSLSRSVAGSFPYLAPEIWDNGLYTAQSDLYALACTMYELITGQLLFDGKGMAQILAAHQAGPRFPETWPAGTPPRAAEALGTALAREPTQRPASATALVAALRRLREAAQLHLHLKSGPELKVEPEGVPGGMLTRGQSLVIHTSPGVLMLKFSQSRTVRRDRRTFWEKLGDHGNPWSAHSEKISHTKYWDHRGQCQVTLAQGENHYQVRIKSKQVVLEPCTPPG